MKKDSKQALLEQFPNAVSDDFAAADYFRGELSFKVEAAQIREVCQFLHDTPGLEFKMLADMAGVDHYQQAFEGEYGRFAVNYHLLSIRWNERIRLKVFWSDGDAPIPSVTSIWQAANWEEREAFDMFGIEFEGHPDLRRILMPDDWQGFPQRKDYPLGYETVQFSFNFDEISKHKPFAKE